MITPLGWLERVPTYKEQIRQLFFRMYSIDDATFAEL